MAKGKGNKIPKPNFNDIPQDMKNLGNWVLWRVEERGGKPTKVPYQASGEMAQANNRRTWSSFATVSKFCLEKKYDGIGFVFSKEDEYIGVDVDGCVVDGKLNDFATEIVETLDSYTEFSPSGTGIHIIIKGEMPEWFKGTGRKNSNLGLEVYRYGRFFTTTGFRENDNEVFERTDEIAELLEKYIDKNDDSLAVNLNDYKGVKPKFPDKKLWEYMFKSKKGEEIRSLYKGDLINNDHSSSDLALLNHLAYWTKNNPKQMDEMFRETGLMRGKWDTIHFRETNETYGERTIGKAIASTINYFPGYDDDTSSKILSNDDVENNKQLPDWIIINKNGTESFRHVVFSKEFLKENKFINTETNLFLFEQDNGWEDVTEQRLYGMIGKKIGDYHSSKRMKEVISYIKANVKTLPKNESFNNLPLNIIPVKNGLYDWEKDKLYPFSYELRHDWKHNVIYNKFAKADRWEDFINYLCPDEKKFLHEFFGYCFYRSYPFAKFLIIFGRGGNGKSTLLGTLIKMLGTGTTTSMSMEDITKDRFSLINLDGKHANILGDDKSDSLDDTTRLKMATGGDQITADVKHKSSVEMLLFSKFIFAFNHMPYIKDTTNGFGRRPELLTIDKPTEQYFENSLREGETWIDYESESSGIFNLMMDGLRNIMKKGGRNPFSVTERMTTSKYNWLYDNNPILQFVEEECKRSDDCKPIDLKEFTRSINFHTNESYKERKIGPELKNLGITVETKMFEGKRGTWVYGMKIPEIRNSVGML